MYLTHKYITNITTIVIPRNPNNSNTCIIYTPLYKANNINFIMTQYIIIKVQCQEKNNYFTFLSNI